MRLLSKHLSTIVIALAVSALVAAGPAIAHGVDHALFAHDAGNLDGRDSKDFVRAKRVTTSITVRRSFPNGSNETLLRLPGLGRLRAFCDAGNAIVRYQNTSPTAVDRWTDYSTPAGLTTDRTMPNEAPTPVAWFETANGMFDGGRLVLGKGTGDQRRTATLAVSPIKEASDKPCLVQVDGTLYVA